MMNLLILFFLGLAVLVAGEITVIPTTVFQTVLTTSEYTTVTPMVQVFADTSSGGGISSTNSIFATMAEVTTYTTVIQSVFGHTSTIGQTSQTSLIASTSSPSPSSMPTSAASPTATSTAAAQGTKKSNTATIAGAAIGALLGVTLLASVGAYFFLRHRKASKPSQEIPHHLTASWNAPRKAPLPRIVPLVPTHAAIPTGPTVPKSMSPPPRPVRPASLTESFMHLAKTDPVPSILRAGPSYESLHNEHEDDGRRKMSPPPLRIVKNASSSGQTSPTLAGSNRSGEEDYEMREIDMRAEHGDSIYPSDSVTSVGRPESPYDPHQRPASSVYSAYDPTMRYDPALRGLDRSMARRNKEKAEKQAMQSPSALRHLRANSTVTEASAVTQMPDFAPGYEFRRLPLEATPMATKTPPRF